MISITRLQSFAVKALLLVFKKNKTEIKMESCYLDDLIARDNRKADITNMYF